MNRIVLHVPDLRTYQPMRRGFSLVEVVVAVGIFAIAVISVIGMLGPISKTVADVRESDDASRVVTVLQAELQRAGIAKVTTFFDTTIYASRSGHKIGEENDSATWDGDDVEDENGNGSTADEENAQKFFEAKITRNTTLSPNSGLNQDDDMGYLAFNIELRWPGYTPDGNKLLGDARDQQSVLIVPAAITR